MRNTRWLKSMVTLAALGLITATGSAQAANVPASSTSSSDLGYCSPAPKPAASNALPGQSAAAALCSQAGAAYVPAASGWRVAGPANVGDTPRLAASAQPAMWRDVGASRPLAGAPASVAAGWLAAIASRENFTAVPALSGPELTWGDAGAGRR